MILAGSNSPQDIATHLGHAMQRTDLPQKARVAGTDLLRRLSSPVRVTLFGDANAGKSTLINVLCGKTLIPPGLVKCPVSLTKGTLSKTIAVATNGERAEFDGVDLEAAAALEPAFIHIEVPLAALQDVSLLEMNIDLSNTDVATQMEWAVSRTDICLWCSRGFTKNDGALWKFIPDTLKDHAYLVVTKVDLLSQPNALKEHLTALAPVINSEFHSVLPVAGRAALSALEARDEEIDVSRWTGSGADALTKAIKRHAARGRREDLDNAQLFLARYGATIDHKSRDAAPVEPALSELPDVGPDPAPAPTSNVTPKVETPVARDPEQVRELWLSAAQTLCASADTIAQSRDNLDSADSQDEILATCIECVENLTEFAEENEDALGEELVNDLTQATEVITLIQLESGSDPARDAIAVLAQLKREFEMNAAA